jgi:hypothetical protein
MADRPIVSRLHVLGNMFALHATPPRARSSCGGRFSIIIRPILASKSRVVMEASDVQGQIDEERDEEAEKEAVIRFGEARRRGGLP